MTDDERALAQQELAVRMVVMSEELGFRSTAQADFATYLDDLLGSTLTFIPPDRSREISVVVDAPLIAAAQNTMNVIRVKIL